MRFFSKFVIAALMVLSLAGCETVEGWTDGKKKAPQEAPPPTISGRLDQAPGVQPVPDFPPPSDEDLRIMTTKLAGGSVEIYDLDGPAPGMDYNGGGVPPVHQDPGGIPLATDPRVTVYPLDGYSTFQQEPSWPNAVLPVTGSVSRADAGPSRFSDERDQAVEGGKLASRAAPGVSNIYFPYGSSSLDGKDRSVLRDVAETAKFAPVDRVKVEGYASAPTQTDDPVKAKILNLKESLKRASTVSEHLIEQGVPAEKLETKAWGDTKPSGGGEAGERRVDIVTGQ
ncbi:MAG TPA: OmpA family protein [Micavibrio sp.]|nr:OmpA family protein [Micavibrio sp.]